MKINKFLLLCISIFITKLFAYSFSKSMLYSPNLNFSCGEDDNGLGYLVAAIIFPFLVGSINIIFYILLLFKHSGNLKIKIKITELIIQPNDKLRFNLIRAGGYLIIISLIKDQIINNPIFYIWDYLFLITSIVLISFYIIFKIGYLKK